MILKKSETPSMISIIPVETSRGIEYLYQIPFFGIFGFNA